GGVPGLPAEQTAEVKGGSEVVAELECGADLVAVPVRVEGSQAGQAFAVAGLVLFLGFEEIGCGDADEVALDAGVEAAVVAGGLAATWRHPGGRIREELAGGAVPDEDLVLLVLTENPFAVGANRHAADKACVPLEGEQSLAAGGIPDLHRPVTAGAGETFAVG